MRRAVVALALAALAAGACGLPARASSVSPSLYQAMRWRFVGPLRGGRTVAIDGIAGQPNVFYIAAVNGGIWKSRDAGRTWMPIFEGEPTGSIGALAVAASDPNVVYAGSGEGLQRPDLAVGNGMYKSVDAGATWTHLGLRDGQQIASIAVDPTDASRLFVAVLGHPYGANDERGVYRSLDGGATFQRVLFANDDTGAFDVTLDPRDPKTVYATLWAARQAPWEIGASFELPGSGVFKSSDGGTTWAQLTAGLPAQIGRTEAAVAPSNSTIVYVYADATVNGDEAGALYRSDDAGAHFARVNDAAEIAQRGDDLVSIAVDPRDPQTIYLTNTSTYRSTDGGRTFVAIKGAPGGDDYHTVWINPSDPSIVALASDQGATISVDGGQTWSSWYNQPTAQMYHVNADDRFPYWLCGGQQESGSACVSSRGAWGQVTQRDWHPVGAQEYGYVVPDPLHPGVFFGGKLEKFDERTGQTQEVSPIALPSKQFRTVRTEPIAFDHFDRQRLYFGSNVVFQTDDGGHSWHAISPDLTRTNPAVPAVLGTFESNDPQHGKHRGVVYAIAPSYVRRGTMWAGTDDGQVWITRDAASTGSAKAHWSNITPPELTPWSKVAQIDASRVDDETAFVAVNRFRLDDLRPYVYITHDAGAHWRLATNGLPNAPVNAVRQDPVQPRLLYAATEDGVSVSFDEGATWQSLQLALPHTSVRDLIVHGNDIAIATHGRGFWILDDVEPLRELAASVTLSGNVTLFTPALAYRVRWNTNSDTPLPPEEPAGQNPPDGAIVDYALGAPAQRVVIEIYDAGGRLVRRFASDDPLPPPIPHLDKPAYWERPFARPQTGLGMHRFVWDLRDPAPHSLTQDLPISAVAGETPRIPQGPLLPPGRYRVRIEADGRTAEQPLIVAMDPRVRISQTSLEYQYRLAQQVASIMDQSAVQAAASATHGDAKAADALAAIGDAAAFLLDTIDGVDAVPTEQAVAAVNALQQRLAQAQAHP